MPVCGISNLADEDDDQLSNADNSDKEIDKSGDEVEDQEEEGDNSAGDDDDNDTENNEEESSEDDNGSDLESEGEKYNAP